MRFVVVLVLLIGVGCAQALFPLPKWIPLKFSRLDAGDVDPCNKGTIDECGKSTSGPFCSQACAWKDDTCVTVDNYPMPANDTLERLTNEQSPLAKSEWLTISFYGDSITMLGVYEAVISEAFANGQGTKNVGIRVINQGVNGGTIKDLVKGYSPWGHLNPSLPPSNITYVGTLDQDHPDIVAVQIGINDVWQAGSSCGSRCSNVTEFTRILEKEIVAPALQRGARVYLASVSTIGEKRDPENPLDPQLDAFTSAVQALAKKLSLPFVNLREVDETYITLNNCMELYSGLLTADGVHPNVPRGATNLANSHAGGILAAVAAHPLPPRPLPPNVTYGGRIFLTTNAHDTNFSGIAGADAICTTEAGGVPSKALIVDETGCCGKPCRRATVTPYLGDGQIDWTLKPNSVYFQWDNKTIAGMTGPNGLFSFPLFFNHMPCTNQASGMAIDWTTVPGGTCKSWTAGEGQGSPTNQSIGWSCALDNGLLFGGATNWACSSNRIICVTQAA